jgi:hypothetical protein
VRGSTPRHDDTGSIFGGRGSVLGVTAQMFEAEDEIRSAIVR